MKALERKARLITFAHILAVADDPEDWVVLLSGWGMHTTWRFLNLR